MKKLVIALLLATAMFFLWAVPADGADGLWVEWMNWCVVERIGGLVVVDEVWGVIHLEGRQAESFTVRVWDQNGFERAYTWHPSDGPVYPDARFPTALVGRQFWLGLLPAGDYQFRVEARIGLRVWSIQGPLRMR